MNEAIAKFRSKLYDPAMQARTVIEETARVAHAAFPKRNTYLLY